MLQDIIADLQRLHTERVLIRFVWCRVAIPSERKPVSCTNRMESYSPETVTLLEMMIPSSGQWLASPQVMLFVRRTHTFGLWCCSIVIARRRDVTLEAATRYRRRNHSQCVGSFRVIEKVCHAQGCVSAVWVWVWGGLPLPNWTQSSIQPRAQYPDAEGHVSPLHKRRVDG